MGTLQQATDPAAKWAFMECKRIALLAGARTGRGTRRLSHLRSLDTRRFRHSVCAQIVMRSPRCLSSILVKSAKQLTGSRFGQPTRYSSACGRPLCYFAHHGAASASVLHRQTAAMIPPLHKWEGNWAGWIRAHEME